MPELTYQKSDHLRLGEQPLSGTSLHNWMKILIENRFQIDWSYIPKGLYVTSLILGFSPFRYLEKRKYDDQIKKVEKIQPIFILGHFRSGTTFLHYLLGQDLKLAYVSTYETMTPGMIIRNEEYFKNIVKNHLPSKRPMDDLEMHANLPYEEEYAIANLSPYSFYHGWYFPNNWKFYFDKYATFKKATDKTIEQWKKTYDYFLKKIAYKNHGKPVLLKSITNTARIKYLLELYPNAKFIHIHRNPYEVYFSTWKLYQSILPIFSFQHIDSKTLDENIYYSYKELYSSYLKEKEHIPQEQLFETNYETFVKNPVEILKEAYNKLSIQSFDIARPQFESYARKHKNYKKSSYQISEEEKEIIYSHWKIMFDAYLYPK